jgi:hypothetical protein
VTSPNNEKLLDQLTIRLSDERVAYVSRERSPAAKKYRDSQDLMLETIRSIGRTGDIGLILSAERQILRNEMRFYGNSAGMRGSLKSALQELDQAEKMLPLVHDSGLYLAVDASHANPKSRANGLPRDAARQFFAAHNVRLLNADRTRLTETEKRILEARRNNIRVASMSYVALQEKALGVDIRQKRELGMSM